MSAAVLPLPLTSAARAAACRVAAASSAADIEAGVHQERDRVLEILRIVKQAARLSVDVDPAPLIEHGADPNDVRAAVLELATEEGSSE